MEGVTTFSGVDTSLYMKKRERTQNWVPEEKSALFELVKVHVNAIENKKLDTASATQKNFAWHKIFQDFRRKFPTERENDKIKAQWTRMKARARLELYTFAAQVKIVGMERASKKMPSQLSIAVWRLLQTIRKSDCEAGENSDESSQDADVINDVDTILDKLPRSDSPELLSFPEIKTEPVSYGFEDPFIPGAGMYSEQEYNSAETRRKRKIILDSLDDNYQSTNVEEQKKSRGETSRNQSYNNTANEQIEDSEDIAETTIPPEDTYPPEIGVDFASWQLKAAQKEHKLKLQILNTDVVRASLQKQTAINDLKTSEIRKNMAEAQSDNYFSQALMSGQPGSGAGKGGGSGGAIRDAGGSFGKMEAAHEDQYFYNQQKEQLKSLRDGLHDEISFHEEQIKRHQEAIKRHNERIGKMEKN